MKVRAYFRVSDEELVLENQLEPVNELLARRGWVLDGEPYREEESAVKRRPVFDQMMRDAEAGRFDTLIIYALDRFGRSLVNNLDAIRRLDRAGVSVVSCRESWLDTSEGPLRHLLVAIFSYVAESERQNLVQRTKLGLARARKEGIKIGRPTVSAAKLDEAMRLWTTGLSPEKVAKEIGINPTTIRQQIKSRGLTRRPPEVQQAAP